MILIAAISLFVSYGSSAQDLRVPQSNLNLRSFVDSVYPDLDGLGVEIEQRTNGTIVSIRVGATDARVESRRVPLLAASVELTAQNEVRSFEARGPFVSDSENDALARDVRQAISDGTDSFDAIARRAPRFGPSERAAFLAKLDRISLAARLGTTHVVSITPVVGPSDTRYGFLWMVALDGTRGDGPRNHYLLAFEPFNGRLISLREQ